MCGSDSLHDWLAVSLPLLVSVRQRREPDGDEYVHRAKTIGVDFGVKQVKIPETDCVVELFLFDCPGQGVFNKLEQVRTTRFTATDSRRWFHENWLVALYVLGHLGCIFSCARNVTRSVHLKNSYAGKTKDQERTHKL